MICNVSSSVCTEGDESSVLCFSPNSQVFKIVALRLSEFEPRQLSSLLWASATLGQAIPHTLMAIIYKETCPNLSTFPVSDHIYCD